MGIWLWDEEHTRETSGQNPRSFSQPPKSRGHFLRELISRENVKFFFFASGSSVLRFSYPASKLTGVLVAGFSCCWIWGLGFYASGLTRAQVKLLGLWIWDPLSVKVMGWANLLKTPQRLRAFSLSLSLKVIRSIFHFYKFINYWGIWEIYRISSRIMSLLIFFRA